MTRVVLGHPETRALARRLKPGYSFRANGSAKFVLVDPSGSVVRNGRGMPVIVPNSPSTSSRIANLRRDLAKLGVLR